MGKVIKAISGVIGKILPTAKMAASPIAAAVMPDRESTAAKLAARRKVESRSKGGREGTIYSGAYSGSNLAGTA